MAVANPDHNEDMWFCSALERVGANIATSDVGRTFSVETVFHDKPLGVHRVYEYVARNESQRRQLYSYCPEAMLVLPPQHLPRRLLDWGTR